MFFYKIRIYASFDMLREGVKISMMDKKLNSLSLDMNYVDV